MLISLITFDKIKLHVMITSLSLHGITHEWESVYSFPAPNSSGSRIIML